jgi:dihydroorotase
MRVVRIATPHTHLREDKKKETVVGALVRHAIEGGAILLGPMPNTEDGLMNAHQVLAYHAPLPSYVLEGEQVVFLKIVQITEKTTMADIDACVAAGIMDAKVYPKGRTTESHNGVSHYMRILDVVRYAGAKGMRVHFHPEHPSAQYDNRDGEFGFLPLMDIFVNETETVLIWEHGTDARCIPFWIEWAKTGRFYVTLTAHHLLANETNTYGDVGAACKPTYKRETDRIGLVELIGKNYVWVMAGADDAPHPTGKKHRIGPCACGAYTAPFLLQLYAHALEHLFDQGKKGLEIFENFIHWNAEGLYGPLPEIYAELTREPFTIPNAYQIGDWTVEPFWAGKKLKFTLRPLEA